MPLDLASSLDTRIRIERKLVTRDPQYGTEQVTWVQFAYVWAEVRDILPSKAERLADSVQIARRPARIRIRYLAGLVADMRVIFDNRIHQIIRGIRFSRRIRIACFLINNKPNISCFMQRSI